MEPEVRALLQFLKDTALFESENPDSFPFHSGFNITTCLPFGLFQQYPFLREEIAAGYLPCMEELMLLNFTRQHWPGSSALTFLQQNMAEYKRLHKAALSSTDSNTTLTETEEKFVSVDLMYTVDQGFYLQVENRIDKTLSINVRVNGKMKTQWPLGKHMEPTRVLPLIHISEQIAAEIITECGRLYSDLEPMEMKFDDCRVMTTEGSVALVVNRNISAYPTNHPIWFVQHWEETEDGTLECVWDPLDSSVNTGELVADDSSAERYPASSYPSDEEVD